MVDIAAGASHSIALRADGSVIAWGDNSNGRSTVPVAALVDVVGIGAAGQASTAIKRDGTVVRWGVRSSMRIPAAWGNYQQFIEDVYVFALLGSPYSLFLERRGMELMTTWSTNLTGSRLQFAPEVSTRSPWTDLSDAPTIRGAQFTQPIAQDADLRFLRVVQP